MRAKLIATETVTNELQSGSLIIKKLQKEQRQDSTNISEINLTQPAYDWSETWATDKQWPVE